ncbi:unnamed protein product, partial [Discosporangium mesarthrocarpum]
FPQVKLAKDTTTGEKVAIKVLEKLWIWKNEMGGMVRREIEVMEGLDHPSIVRLIKVLNSRTHVFMVMEYVDGMELYEEIARSGSIPEDRARSLFRQVSRG